MGQWLDQINGRPQDTSFTGIGGAKISDSSKSSDQTAEDK